MPLTTDNTMTAYSEHEKLTAIRMHWWGVYLIREQRRLQGIADRVRAQQAAEAVGHTPPALRETEGVDEHPPVPNDGGAPEGLLMRLDMVVAEEDALAEIEEAESDEASDRKTDCL